MRKGCYWILKEKENCRNPSLRLVHIERERKRLFILEGEREMNRVVEIYVNWEVSSK